MKILPITTYPQIAGGKMPPAERSAKLDICFGASFGTSPASPESQLAACRIMYGEVRADLASRQVIQDLADDIQQWMKIIRSGQAVGMNGIDFLHQSE